MSAPLVVAHCIATNFFGGPERQVLTHLKLVREQGVRPLVISFSGDGRSNETLELAGQAGLDTACLDGSRPFDPRNVWALRSILVERGVGLLVSHGYKANVIGRLACWMAGVPKLAVSRGWTGENPRVRLYEKLDRLFLRLADRVVAVSDGQRRKILNAGVTPAKVQVIHNAIALGDVPGPDASLPGRASLGIPREALLVGTAGRLSPEKNHLGFVRAAAKVRESLPEAHFVVWGEGALRAELESEAARLGLSGRFHMPGFSRDVRRLFHELDIFVLPSHTEGLSNVILEAFACSRPVVATAVGGNPEVVEDGVSGILTPAGDDAALARAVLTLAASPELRRAMGAAGFERVAGQFGFEAQTARYAALYRELASRGRAA